MLNEASKVDAILNAWFDYIALDDYSSARIKVANQDTVKQRGIKLVRDHVLIETDIFSELQEKVAKRQKDQQEAVWVLSFPQILDVENRKSYFCPLFSLDITSILKGEYRKDGWNLDNLTLTEAGDNLATFLGLDDEQQEQLITQDGLRRFLETTFELTFDSYQDWMEQIIIPCRYRQQIQRQPYLFNFTGGRFTGNLRKDLKDIKSRSKYWLKQGHPAREYLFGTPQDHQDEITYMGAFPTHAPTNSQLTAIKHAQTEPVTAVQGPPGSGKTTLILHLIAQQVVQRAISLVENDEDINNLTVVSSTNNKAVENVIEKLNESLNNRIFYLKGGSKPNIQSAGGAIEKLNTAIDYLQKNSFNANRCTIIKQQIKSIKYELSQQELHYLELRRQRSFAEQNMPHLKQKYQAIIEQLDRDKQARSNFQIRVRDLAEYEQFPTEAYRQIKSRFDTAELQLPGVNLPWWIRLWRWLIGKTEQNILANMKSACHSAIQSTSSTSFPVEAPKNRSDLVRQAQLVRERLDKADELKNVQEKLQEISETLISRERERSEIGSELSDLERRLETELEDFYTSFHENFHDKHQELFKLSLLFLDQQALLYKERVNSTLSLYVNMLSGQWKNKSKMAENLDDNIKYLSLMFPVITSTLLSIRNMLPWVEECVDRTIIDEAGMIPLHQTFPLLVRSRKAIIVGDPFQIEPVISLSDQRRDNYFHTAFLDKGLTEIDYHCYSPEEYSATSYHRAAGARGEDNDKGKGICLIEHYRCQPSIIQYCNKIANYGLEVKTAPVTSLLESNLIAYHVEGNIKGNVNQEEVTAIGDLIQHLYNQGYSLKDIGVISAFRAQADALRDGLRRNLPDLDKKSIGTIHTFQGSEKKVIILSTKVCRPQDNVAWINRRPNLLNVAVSRAKELFILVGNLYRLEKAGNYTRQLVEHIRDQGNILEYKSEVEIPKQQPGSVLIYNCDHLNILKEAIDQAEQELVIVTPWIRGEEPKYFVNDVVSALERGVKVTLVYGHKTSEENEHDNNDVYAEKNLKELFEHYPGSDLIRLGEAIHIESKGTNEKILICDTKFAVFGSWNWLSHPYRSQCIRRSLINPKVQIRRETSIKISDLSSIADVKARIYSLRTQ